MKQLARLLAALYPRSWRARYAAEFDALIEEADLLWQDLFGLAAGALLMRIGARSTRHRPKGERAMDNQSAHLRMIDIRDRDIPHGYEIETVLEQTEADGSHILTHQFFRELDFGDSYLTISHHSRGSEPARTFVVSGAKGEIEGDFRTDRTEMITWNTDGSLRRSEQRVKTWMKAEFIRERVRRRYSAGLHAGLTPDQVFQQLRLESDWDLKEILKEAR